MKKVSVLVVIMLCAAFIVPCMAQEAKETPAKQKQVLVDKNNDGKPDEIDIYDDSGKIVKRGYDTNNDMVVDQWETYDENTGMPIVTESDKSFELR